MKFLLFYEIKNKETNKLLKSALILSPNYLQFKNKEEVFKNKCQIKKDFECFLERKKGFMPNFQKLIITEIRF